MNPNKVLWEKGDFTQIAQGMRESGDALVAELNVTADLDVLDLGCGDGTTAIPEADGGPGYWASTLPGIWSKRATHGLKRKG